MCARFILPSLLALALVFGCTEEENPIDVPIEHNETEDDTVSLDPNFQYCDSTEIANSIGTSCCISGSTIAKAGDTLTYFYQINHSDDLASWQVFEGDIAIIAGADSTTVTVVFGPSFTKGIILGHGSGVKDSRRLTCNDRVIVNRE